MMPDTPDPAETKAAAIERAQKLVGRIKLEQERRVHRDTETEPQRFTRICNTPEAWQKL